MTTATLTYTPGRFVWHELFTHDVAAAKKFYGELCGWTAQDMPMGPDFNYTIFSIGELQVGGMMAIADIPGDHAGIPPHWALYVSVDDVDAAAKRAEAAGGTLLGECRDIPNVGRFAIVRDPQGAIFNLFKSSTGDAPDEEVRTWGRFCWESLATTDLPGAIAFYEKVVGWGTNAMGVGEQAVTLFNRQKANGESIGVASTGVVSDGQPPNWGTFISVEDANASLAKAKALGAQVFVERTPLPGVGAFAVIQDPTGSVVYFFEPLPTN